MPNWIPIPPPPVSRKDLSEVERQNYRTACYPDVLDDQGREWKMGMIIDLQSENERLKKRIQELENA